MSLENEYYNEKQLLKNAQEKISKMESLDVENMTQEQLEARERVIKGAKEDIKESEELLEEIKEELVEFINNGGEVSEKTKEEINYFESYDVSFKVVSNRNNEVYVEGYVTINDEEAEDVDWYYYDANGFATPQLFVEHDGVTIEGATDKQRWEVEQFRGDYGEDSSWIDEVILQSDEDGNRTYVRENLTLIINEGAKIECEINDDFERQPLGGFIVELIPKFNGKNLYLSQFMKEQGIIFDPYSIGEDDANFFIEDGHIYFEISKDWFEGDDEDRKDNLTTFINPEVEWIYKRYLVSNENLGVYGVAGCIYEEMHGKLDESDADAFASMWEQSFEQMDVHELYLMSDEDVEQIIKEELDGDDY